MTGIHFLRGQETPKRHSACGVSARYFALVCFWCFPIIAQTLPSAPTPKIDLSFNLAEGISAGVDTWATCSNLNRGGRELTLPIHTCAQMVGFQAGEHVLGFAVSKLMKRNRVLRRFARAPQIYLTIGNTRGAAYSLKHR